MKVAQKPDHVRLNNLLSRLRKGRFVIPDFQLRLLDGKVEAIELRLRERFARTVAGEASQIPPHLIQKVNERIARALKENAAMDATYYGTVPGLLEYFDLREIQETIVPKNLWLMFEPLFGTKEALIGKFDQLAELRNGIRHSRSASEITRTEVEVSILWFNPVLRK